MRPFPLFSFIFLFLFDLFTISNLFTHCVVAAKCPSLSKFHRDRIHRARLHTDRSFRSLVTLRRLAKWGLGPEPSDEAIAHEVTVRKSKL